MSARERVWLEVGVHALAPDERTALIVDGLVALGGRAVEERDGCFYTHVPLPEDSTAWLENARKVLIAVSGIADVEITTREVPAEDWAEAWKRGLAPRRITPRLVVTPTWHTPDVRPGDLVVTLDPGMAFGTAEHGTTRGCLRLLDRAVARGDRLLDVGAGSGILSIAAARMGAAEVVAVEGDALAVEVIEENIHRNHVAGVVRCVPRWADVALLASLGPREGVVANIESRILESLMPGFHAALRPGGWLLLSGILAEEWPHVRTCAEEAGFRFDALDKDGEWRSARMVRTS